MKKLVVNLKDDSRYYVDDDPVCGEDFCDSCGDCLVCYYDDPCYGNESECHLWVEYVNQRSDKVEKE